MLLIFTLIGLFGGVSATLQAFDVHNPFNVEVTTIHMVQGSHLDIGCKTPGCSTQLIDGEPDRCAITSLKPAEPWAYHIINRHLDEYLLLAVANANATRNTSTPYRYLSQPWILSIFFDCENTGIVSWPGSGWRDAAMPVLHCPNATTIAEVRGALQRGDIFTHAFPNNAEASYFSDASLFDAALAIAADLSASLGIPAPRSVSQRDVPGWTRAAIPLLAKRNITGLSFGAGNPPGKPDTPMLFVWKDIASGTDVVTTYETKYGDVSTVFVLPNGEALAVAWYSDNKGPAPIEMCQADYAALQTRFPSATVVSSTFDEFFDVANQPDIKRQLPVVTEEIGDGWIYGVPSDPLKNAQFKEACRQRTACVASGKCNPASASMKAFDRLLVKVPEHTWGISMAWFLPDYENMSNPLFEAARSSVQPLGFLKNRSTGGGDYNTTVNSWIEQRLFVTEAPKLLATDHPQLATSLATALYDLAHVTIPTPTGSLVDNPTTATFMCRGLEVGFDARGAITTLGSLGDATHPLGLYQYQTFTNEDYNVFLQDFAARGDGDCTNIKPGDPDSTKCYGFRKPNVTSANPKHRVVFPSLTKLWHTATNDGCDFTVEMAMDTEVHTLAGAPERIVANVVVNATQNTVEWDVVQVNKQATRLPEAGFFSFNPAPAAADPKGYTLDVLGSVMDPRDVVGSGPGGSNLNASVYGGSPHLRGVEAVSWTAQSPSTSSLRLTSLDVPIVCTGVATPFVTPRTQAPDMREGVHFNIFQNIWNTNYVLWYPFSPEDKNVRSRFKLEFQR
eukprot:m.23826 g.23826  ORF g.23826 m.23826 type:complete len:790 (+) comp14371_c0_seq1:140-2509(+)